MMNGGGAIVCKESNVIASRKLMCVSSATSSKTRNRFCETLFFVARFLISVLLSIVSKKRNDDAIVSYLYQSATVQD